MTGLELVGASALYLGGVYIACMIVIWLTDLMSPQVDSIITAVFCCMLGGGFAVLLGLAALGFKLAEWWM